MTCGQALGYARERLSHLDSPSLEAECLLAHATGMSRLEMLVHPDKLLSPDEESRYADCVSQRAAGRPLAYITGSKEFLDFSLLTAPGALIPRQETELLCERAAARLGAGARVCDMGTGSGAVAAGIASLMTDCHITACDVSEEALALARRNLARLGLTDRTETLLTDWFEGLSGRLFDAIVSNPPYIPTAVIDTLEPCVRDFEPRLALDGGPDGLAAYRVLFTRGKEHLASGGFIACEIGSDQGEAVCAIARSQGFLPELGKDYAGLDRTVIAGKKDT